MQVLDTGSPSGGANPLGAFSHWWDLSTIFPYPLWRGAWQLRVGGNSVCDPCYHLQGNKVCPGTSEVLALWACNSFILIHSFTKHLLNTHCGEHHARCLGKQIKAGGVGSPSQQMHPHSHMVYVPVGWALGGVGCWGEGAGTPGCRAEGQV